MSKKKRQQSNQQIKVKIKTDSRSFWRKIKDFFFPSDFMGEIYRGQKMGIQIRTNELDKHQLLKIPYNAGKEIRKLIDPKHKMKF